MVFQFYYKNLIIWHSSLPYVFDIVIILWVLPQHQQRQAHIQEVVYSAPQGWQITLWISRWSSRMRSWPMPLTISVLLTRLEKVDSQWSSMEWYEDRSSRLYISVFPSLLHSSYSLGHLFHALSKIINLLWVFCLFWKTKLKSSWAVLI